MSQKSLLDFADKMNEIMPQLMKEFSRWQLDALYKDKITLPQFLILELLSREPGSNMTLLADFMRVTTAAMTGMVDRMVRDNYIVRQFDDKDRRIIKLRLTPRGNDLIKKIKEQKRKFTIEVFGKISEKDRNEYLRILMRIKDILTKQE